MVVLTRARFLGHAGNPEDPFEIMRLGFLSDGAFFGEAPVLGRTETSLELRMRCAVVQETATWTSSPAALPIHAGVPGSSPGVWRTGR